MSAREAAGKSRTRQSGVKRIPANSSAPTRAVVQMVVDAPMAAASRPPRRLPRGQAPQKNVRKTALMGPSKCGGDIA